MSHAHWLLTTRIEISSAKNCLLKVAPLFSPLAWINWNFVCLPIDNKNKPIIAHEKLVIVKKIIDARLNVRVPLPTESCQSTIQPHPCVCVSWADLSTIAGSHRAQTSTDAAQRAESNGRPKVVGKCFHKGLGRFQDCKPTVLSGWS